MRIAPREGCTAVESSAARQTRPAGKEIAPFAYNKGVKDAESYFRGRIEDLSGTFFEPALTYWLKKKK